MRGYWHRSVAIVAGLVAGLAAVISWPRRCAGEWLRSFAAVVLVVGGTAGLLIGGGAYVHAWYTGWAWAQSGDGERAERRLDAEAPLWVDAGEPAGSPSSDALVEVGQVPGRSADGWDLTRPAPPARDPFERVGDLPLASGDVSGLSAPSPAPDAVRRDEPADAAPLASAAPSPRAAAEEIALTQVDFRFLDPPEPGAHARLAVALRSHADAPSGPISLRIASRWFEGYRVIGTIPEVAADRVDAEFRSFEFPSLDPGVAVELELHVTASDEDVDAPEVVVGLLGGEPIGQVRPRTVAPRPRPGPASALGIPQLGVRAGVVQTAWEPPPFVVGQIRGTAHLGQGNTVLIGHVAGAAGNVFARLEQLRPGDEIVAASRGLEYRFLVSDATVRPSDDSSPTLPSDSPRLTLMTCVGRWDPIRGDYSHRLWVMAEPPELAQVTIAANAERAAREAATDEPLPPDPTAASPATLVPAPPTAAPLAPAPPVQAPPAQVPVAQAPVAQAPMEIRPPASGPPPGAAPAAPRRATVAPPPTPTAVTPTPRRPVPAGLAIQSPYDGGRVPRKLAVRGTQARPVDPSVHVWLFARAQVEGGHWYPHPREIVAKPSGAWEAELELGGPANVRHELSIGVAGSATHAALLRHVATRPNEPLLELPEGFDEEVTLVVTRS